MKKSGFNHYQFVCAFISVLILTGTQCRAWISTGHKVIALIAWDDLTPKTRAAITELLKQHPRYQKDLLIDAPAGQSPDDQARTAFATAATWPDMVRSPANPMNFTHNHPAWHYIDIPYVVGNVTPPPANVDGPGPHNIVEALNQCMTELKDPKTPDEVKAVDLCWIEHLVGDIHQPLHAVSEYKPELPDGDRGGNSQIVMRDNYADSRTNLHLLWDSLPGNYATEDFCVFLASGMRADPNLSREKMKEMFATTDFMGWAKESHQLAIEFVYLNGTLQTQISSHDHQPATQPVPLLPANYLKNAEHVALKRVALSGYRLADLLNGLFDPK